MAKENTKNTMRRHLLADSPIYAPFAVNLGFLLIAGCFMIYNLADVPTIEQIAKISNSALTKA